MERKCGSQERLFASLGATSEAEFPANFRAAKSFQVENCEIPNFAFDLALLAAGRPAG